MNIKHFQYIRAVAECSTLSAAAEKLFISQPALSQQIRKIEDELCVELFAREGRSMVLTPQGEIFLRGGNRILQIYGSIKQELQLSKSMEASAVRFGISPFYSQHYLPKLYYLPVCQFADQGRYHRGNIRQFGAEADQRRSGFLCAAALSSERSIGV